jgi:hypothetical protein
VSEKVGLRIDVVWAVFPHYSRSVEEDTANLWNLTVPRDSDAAKRQRGKSLLQVRFAIYEKRRKGPRPLLDAIGLPTRHSEVDVSWAGF